MVLVATWQGESCGWTNEMRTWTSELGLLFLIIPLEALHVLLIWAMRHLVVCRVNGIQAFG